MKKLFSGAFASALVAAALTHSGVASAQSTWNMNAAACDPSPTQTAYTAGGNTVSCSTGIPAETITITAWSNAVAGGTGNFTRASIGDFGTSGLGAYSGSGETGTDSQHALDNVTTGCGGGTGAAGTGGCGGSQEFLLINFGPYKVNLSALSIGFRGTDADVAILRWDGADQTAAQMSTLLSGKNTSNFTTGTGWTLIGTQSLDGAIADSTEINLGNQVSSWFIVSTYYGTTAAATAGTLDTGNDRFKVLTLTGNVCTSGSYTGGNQGNGGTCTPGVPEPGSLALAGLALVGVVGSRRRILRKFA